MLVPNRGIVIIMANPQKTVFLIKKSCIYAQKKEEDVYNDVNTNKTRV